MNEPSKRLLYWAPRILCIAFAAFLALFALDVFQLELEAAELILALFMHLIPTLLVLAALAIVWTREWIGAILFPLLALLHLVSSWGHLAWTAMAVIEAPLLIVGVLFWLNWRYRGKSGGTEPRAA